MRILVTNSQRVASRFRTPLFAATTMAIVAVALTGCRKDAPSATNQNPQVPHRQFGSGDALLKAAASQLNDLPASVDTELRAPVVILDSRKFEPRHDILATCTVNPTARDGAINVIRVPAGNSGFRSFGVRAGDILKYYVLEDKTVDEDSRKAGYSRQLAMDLTVAQVLDDSTLLVENGLNQEVTEPRKIEVWRNADDRLHEIREEFGLYEVYRNPPIAWEPAPDEVVLNQVMAWLKQWIRQNDPKTDWRPDPLLETLGADLSGNKELAASLAPAALSATTFRPEDGRTLQEAIWLRDISRWAHGESFDDLPRTTALFDWTVRNIQLEADKNAPPHRPWQTLLYGRGTADQRTWVFAMLCRQQGLDVVMLTAAPTVAQEKSDATPASSRFALPALLSEGQLYLFDPRLGLPLPGPGGKGVATLEQVRKDDSLLRQLDIGDAKYPLHADSFKNIKVDLVADPFSLSRRASQIEASLSGDDRMILSAKPSELAARLKGIAGITAIQLWKYPFSTLRDQLSLGKAARHLEALEFEPFAQRPTLWKARTRHFQGRRQEAGAKNADPLADNLDDHQEAARLYMSKSVRPTDKEIGESESEGKRRVDSAAKLNAAYWLGLMSFDDGKYSVAVNWLGRPELKSADSPWLSGANYNRARALEAQGKFDEARAILEHDTSPQQQGNKLRATCCRGGPRHRSSLNEIFFSC